MHDQIAFRVGIRGSRRRPVRRGVIVVKFAILMTAMMGMIGLVVDTGMLISTHRQAQNAADAAALSAAVDMINGGSEGQAEANAAKFVQDYNGLAEAVGPFLNFPPTQGAYAGKPDYVEAVVNYPLNTYFIHILPGVSRSQIVSARAVATWAEYSTAGEGVIVLDPDARPGLNVAGGGRLRVHGIVFVNSEGGGVDENDVDVDNGNTGVAASGGQPNSDAGIYTAGIYVVGGVDRPEQFKNIDGGGAATLKAKQLPVPDPLLNLATPTTSTGLRAVYHGAIAVGDLDSSLVNSPDPSGENTYDPATDTSYMHPGLYDSIGITGGNVVLRPGIYVTMGGKSVAFKINGGNIVADGVMFYNTGDNFDPYTGAPDVNDGNLRPPYPDDARVGGVTLNAATKLSPIDTTNPNFDYSDQPGIETFNGMLFFQRRRNTQTASITGGDSVGLTGTIYAKWARFKLSGQGTYDAQFVVGSMTVTGQGDVILSYGGKNRGKAPGVFLVE